MAVLNNIFPPVLDTYMPAFSLKATGGCRVYFSLSSYNTFNDIYEAQITVSNQYTNKSVLNTTNYPNAIKLMAIQEDTERLSDDRYYITISSEDLTDGFQQNTYYKVQIRFTANNTPNKELSREQRQKDINWFNQYLDYFSEWSKVCLIKGINPPTVNIKNFIEGIGYGTTFSTPFVDFVGNVVFSEGETETLKSYQIKLYDSNNTLIVNTNEIYSDIYSGVNEINYIFKNEFQDAEKYKIELIITTQNLFVSTHFFNFSIKLAATDPLNLQTSLEADEPNARIKIVLKTTGAFADSIIIKRTSSLSNFNLWEDVHIYTFITQVEGEYTWCDYSIENGVWYKYAIQKGDKKGNRGAVTVLNEEPVILNFDDIFLTTKDRQLKIKFDPTVNSLKYNVAENKTDTIGSKYPFIRKNGNIFYRQIPLSGLISFLSDESELFVSEKELYGDCQNYYKDFNLKNRITSYNDFVKEKMFRDKVIEFLHDSSIKLFRSATEGNILVKLMDISFTPEASLGRYLYRFSCTAYEIDEASVENLNKYNIQTLGDFGITDESTGEVVVSYPVFGQYVINKSSEDLIPAITNNHPVATGYKGVIQYFTYLHVEMNTKDTPAYKIDDNGISYLGYEMWINGMKIIINQDGYYEIENSEGFQITTLKFGGGADGLINYKMVLGEIASTSTTSVEAVAAATQYITGVGQLPLENTYVCGASVYDVIADTYLQEDSLPIQRLINLKGLKIEGEKGIIVFVKEGSDTNFNKYQIGKTNSISFSDVNTIIKDFYFNGILLEGNDVDLDRLSEKEGVIYYNYNNIDYPVTLYQLISSDYVVLSGNLSAVINQIAAIEVLADVSANVEYVYEIERIVE